MKMSVARHHWRRRGRRGIAPIVATVILILISAVLGIVAYAMANGLIGGATGQPTIQYGSSQIKVNAATGAGTVFIDLYNQGPGSIRISSLNFTDKGGNLYSISFASTGPVDKDAGTGTSVSKTQTWSGSTGVGIVPSGSKFYLAIPTGGRVSLTLTFDGSSGHVITGDFDIGATYSGFIIPVSGSSIPVSVPVSSTP